VTLNTINPQAINQPMFSILERTDMFYIAFKDCKKKEEKKLNLSSYSHVKISRASKDEHCTRVVRRENYTCPIIINI
jgi:hypothetical protein